MRPCFPPQLVSYVYKLFFVEKKKPDWFDQIDIKKKKSDHKRKELLSAAADVCAVVAQMRLV